MNNKFDYLFSETIPFECGDIIAPGMTVRKALRCIGCLVPDKFLDSVFCTQKRYWIEENLNLIISHCSLVSPNEQERTFLMCKEEVCNTNCKNKCLNNKIREEL